MGTCCVGEMVASRSYLVRVCEVVISRMTPRTRSSMRLRDSFQANRERNMVLWGYREMLSARRARMCDGLYAPPFRT